MDILFNKNKPEKIIILTVILFASLCVHGQSKVLGIKSGPCWTNAYTKKFLSPLDNKLGVVYGLTYEKFFNKHFFHGAELIHSPRGFSYSEKLTDMWGNTLNSKLTAEFSYDYISIPLKYGYACGNKLFFNAALGIVPSIIIKAESLLPTSGSFYSSSYRRYDTRKSVNKFDIGGLAEIGGGYIYNERFRILLSLNYMRSFRTITTVGYYEKSKIYNYGISLNLGVKYALVLDKSNSAVE